MVAVSRLASQRYREPSHSGNAQVNLGQIEMLAVTVSVQ